MIQYWGNLFLNEPRHDKTNKVACAPSEDSDQPGHPPSLIRVFAVRMKKPWVLSYPLSAQRRLWSDWADDQADLSLRWGHMPLCWFCHEAAQIRKEKHDGNKSLPISLVYVKPLSKESGSKKQQLWDKTFHEKWFLKKLAPKKKS